MISGDYEWAPNLWNDRDKPFWGDDELETSSNDFDIIPQKRHYRCINCTTRAHINKRYCTHCVKISKNKPTRALRQKIKRSPHFTKFKKHILYVNKPNNPKTAASRKRIKYVLNPLYSNLPCVFKKENIPSTDSDIDIETADLEFTVDFSWTDLQIKTKQRYFEVLFALLQCCNTEGEETVPQYASERKNTLCSGTQGQNYVQNVSIAEERHIERMQRRARTKVNVQEELSCELSFDLKSPGGTESSSETKLYPQGPCIICDKRIHDIVVIHSNGKHHGFCSGCALRFLKSNEECAVCNRRVIDVMSV